MTAPLSYPGIKPLLTGVRQDADHVHCQFTCPVSGEVLRASAPLEHSQGGLLSSVALGLSNMFRSVLGGGGEDSGAAVDPDQSDEQVNLQQRQDAIVRAFTSCSPPFLWDKERQSWISSPAAGDLRADFDRLIQDAPIEDLADRTMAARIMVAVAKVDGALKPDEWRFLSKFVRPDVGSVDDFMDQPIPTADELAAIPAGPEVRETVLLMGWAMALSEGEVDAGEATLLADYAQALGIAPERAAELRRHGEHFYLDRALKASYPNGVVDAARRAEVDAAAAKLGVEASVVADLESRFLMRNGIV